MESIHTSPDKDALRTGGLTSFSRHTFAMLKPGSLVIEPDSHLCGDSSKLVGDEVCRDFIRCWSFSAWEEHTTSCQRSDSWGQCTKPRLFCSLWEGMYNQVAGVGLLQEGCGNKVLWKPCLSDSLCFNVLAHVAGLSSIQALWLCPGL